MYGSSSLVLLSNSAIGFIRWSLDSSIRAEVQSISRSRLDALVKIGMGRRHPHRIVGRKTIDRLVNARRDAIMVTDKERPWLKERLKHYRDCKEGSHRCRNGTGCEIAETAPVERLGPFSLRVSDDFDQFRRGSLTDFGDRPVP